MADLESVTLGQLTVAERAEVDTALRGSPAFLADNDDVVALWLFLLMAGCGGIGVYFLGGIPVPYAREALLLAGLGLIIWTVQTWVRTWKRRGCVFTSFGTYRLRGSKLRGVRHANLAAIKCRTIGRSGKRFTVFELVANDKRELTLYAHAAWAEAAIATIQQARGGMIPVSER